MNFWRQVPTATKVYLAVLGYLIVLLIGLVFVRLSNGSLQGSAIWKFFSQKHDASSITLTPERTINVQASPLPPGSAVINTTASTSVREGPGNQFPEIALLEPDQIVPIEGVSHDKKWWAINLPYYSEGRGWVAVDSVIAENVTKVKEIAFETKEPVSTNTESGASILAIANVNVRSGPDIKYLKIGNIKKGQSAEVIGVSNDNFWWLIKLPDAKNVQGWISRDYVIARNTDNVPIIGPQAGVEQTLAPGSPYLVAVVGVNIRAGPDVTYAVVGQLTQGQLAEIVGVTKDGLWWAINYPAGDAGRGWVAAAYVKTENSGSVPVLK
jgi:uncharacterized protein YraI